VVQVSDGSPVLGQSFEPPAQPRPVDLLTSESLSGGDFVLAALGGAGVALLLAGLGVVLAAGRRRDVPQPQPVRSGEGS
jgi:hypothetical protein